ncbi:Acyl-CoA dehydrogenase domain-containing protein [uncultured Mycobacterium sp.]|uniref:Acyl-CoA dehydrogenase domain-containing protein n=1 Tax=uncultured Mycobacterium sp. TaxID=171292 RepID=A0A1Y5PHD4_9MYCO|nr:Acyl-CoA dehydrogenase domain-containing protein [uncultured Mycobacterium sp.]
MNFDLTDEQELLRDTAREVFSRAYDTESRNKIVDSELGWSRDVWRQLADIGILGLGFDPEESGQIEIMVVMTEIGRQLAPEPVATAALIPGGLIADLGSDEQRALLDEVAAGEKLLALAHAEKGLRGLDELSTRAIKDSDGWTITGRKNPVLAGDSADVIVVTASLPDGGVGAFLVDAGATTRHPYRTFDGLRGAEIDFADAPAQQLGDGDVSEHIHATLIRYSSALCAEAVGAMDESIRLTTEYLNARKQFGVPLKTFQTLTQRAADMYVSLELARSMNYYAAMCITDGRLDPVVAARSKLQIGRSGRHILQESIQMHGGIGVTAEYPVAHYAARLTAIDQTLGSATDQLRFLSKQVGAYGVVTL